MSELDKLGIHVKLKGEVRLPTGWPHGPNRHQHPLYDCGGKGHGSDVSEVQWCHDCTPHGIIDYVERQPA